jgi:hypothetical protein
MSDRNLKTDVGTFNVIVKDDMEIDAWSREMKKVGISISVGSKKNKCVYITAPDKGNIAKLHNVRTRGLMCEIHGVALGGEKTVEMVQLAFTVLAESAPHIKFVELDDNSEFPCALNDGSGKVVGISLALYELAFHRSTWHERHFGAELSNKVLRSLYKKDGFVKTKSPTYDFNHSELNEVLGPIYAKTTTWEMFFNEIYKMEHRCKLLIPWYKDALKMIMGANISFADPDWTIDLSNSKVKKIAYTPIVEGGGKKTKTMKLSKSKSLITQNKNTYDYIEDMSAIIYTPSDFRISGD